MSESINSRRQFLKMAAVGSASLMVLSTVAQAEEKRRAAKPASAGGDKAEAVNFVKPGEGMAASVNYQEDPEKAIKDPALKVDRQGVKFAKQKCSGCMLYTSEGKKGGVEAGKCTLFANQLVKANGWCSSWSKRP